MNKILLGIIVVVALVVGFYLASSGAPAASSTANTPAIQGASNAQAAPDFTLDRLDGGKISLADYKGKKPVILGFWTTWCPNCRRDMPHQN